MIDMNLDIPMRDNTHKSKADNCCCHKLNLPRKAFITYF